MRYFARATIAVITCAAVWCVPIGVASVAAASPGDHLWSDWVYTSDVFEDEQAAAVTIAPGGYPVIVGTAVGAPGDDSDIRYVSYEASTSLWRWNAVPLTWDGAAGGDDRAAGVVTDAAGNAYIAGTTTVAGGTTDIVILKVLGTDPVGPLSGDLLWARQYDGSAGEDDAAEAIATDAAGNVYITGSSVNAAGNMDVVTVKYRPDGRPAWVRLLDSPSKKLDRGLAIAVRGTAVYVAGVSRRSGSADDVVLIKYTTAGKRQWVRYYDDPLHRSEGVTGIACTSSSIYLCGAGKVGVVAPGDALLLKYDATGALKWARYAGGKAGDDAWSDVAVDNKGQVHVTGTFFRRATADDIATSVYGAGGGVLWAAWFSSAGAGLDTGRALAVDAARRTYVCGSIWRPTGDSDMAVLCYGPSGTTTQWFSRYPDPSAYLTETNWGDDRAADIALAGAAVYVAGASTVYHDLSGGGYGGTSLDFLTLKLER
jgi:hypothetical protein